MWIATKGGIGIEAHLVRLRRCDKHCNLDFHYYSGNFNTLQTLNTHMGNYKCPVLTQMRVTPPLNAAIDWGKVWKDSKKPNSHINN